jgi:nucleotide-binding universal stress UspA family protein
VRADIAAREPQPFDYAKHKAGSHRIFRLLAGQVVRQAEQELKAKSADKIRSLVLEGNPAEQIIKAIADERPDLVICGAKGLSNFTALLLGSVSNRSYTCITVR